MPRGDLLINQLNGGEVSSKLDTRADVEKYKSTCIVLENAIPIVEGGATKTPGTYFATSTKDSSKKSRMVKFHFSTIQAYALEFGDRYIRFYKDEGQIVTTYAAWVTGTPYYPGRLVTEAGSYYRCVTYHVAAALFATDLAAGRWVVTTGATDTVYEIPTPYLEADLFELDVETQTADTLYITHESYAPAILGRYDHDDWRLSNPVYMSGVTQIFDAVGEYPACCALYEQRLAFGGATNTPRQVDLSASGDYDDFTKDADDDSAAITYTLDSKKVDRIWWMMGQEILALGTSGGVWRLGGSSTNEPLTASNVSAKKQTSIGVSRVQPQMVGDSILWVTRSGRRVRNFVYSLESDKWKAPDMTRLASHIAVGATKLLSGIVDMDYQEEPIPILWAVRKDGQLIGLTCEIDENVYAWFRLITDGYYESVAVINQTNDEDQVWGIVRRVINGVTKRYVEFFKPHDFFSQIQDCFFVHSGLTWDGGDAITITGITQANPAVVTATAHTFHNGDKVRIKSVVGMTEVNCDPSEAYTVANAAANTFELSGIDSTGWTAYASGGTAQEVKNTLTNLGHLEGKSVSLLMDGSVHPNETVTASTITMNRYGNLIHVGLPYTTVIEPMKLNIPTGAGTSKGKKQKVSELTISFYETAYAKYGPDEDNMQEIPFGTGGTLELFSGDKSNLEFNGDWDDKALVRIESDLPLPMTILAIVPKFNVSND